MDRTFYAHTDPTSPKPPEGWEPLFTADAAECPALEGAPFAKCERCEGLERRHGHLNKVAWWTAKFASELFPAGSDEARAGWQWGYLAGLWHDLGKFAPEFQQKLLGERVQVEHTGAGAALASRAKIVGWEALAFVIAGHHAGLANVSAKEPDDSLTPLDERIKRSIPGMEECRSVLIKNCNVAGWLYDPIAQPPLLTWMHGVTSEARISYGGFVRMLFSALVDADSVATEKFCVPNEKKTLLRHQPVYDKLEMLRERLDDHLETMSSDAQATEVNSRRADILHYCREAARQKRGFFTLNVPTGGGKTLAAMSFALRHALSEPSNGFRRVIVAVPYTSIIEQNASIYREALGANNVIEHHSNLDDLAKVEEEKENEVNSEATIRRRLACENWDAPIIVTTNVQLFESLFANKRRNARKLHNIAGSVIILDEAQCVPVGFMQLILLGLRDLVEHYGCSLVISTATQPAWKHRKSLPYGIQINLLRDIIPAEADLLHAAAFDRVEITWPQDDVPLSYDELAGKLAAESCVMAIVHRKKDAQLLANTVRKLKPGERLFHLSTNMCPAHRRQVLAQIRIALKDFRQQETPCRVISTQLVEAGVDLDFPVLYRALAGLDSVAQAAGRCNREGRMSPGKGRVVVFIAETEPPDGHLKHCFEVSRKMLAEHVDAVGQRGLDLRSAAVFEEFFVRLYRDRKLDEKDLMRHANGLNFETLGREFRLIDDKEQVVVVIAFDGEAERRLEQASKITTYRTEAEADRYALRALQPYSVAVFAKGLENIRRALEPLFPGSAAWKLDRILYSSTYDAVFGLVVDDEPQIDLGRLVCDGS